MKKIKTTFFKDFKDFITRGNVVDMAVGVIIGGSFGKIVTGLVNYILNPFLALFIKDGNLDSVKTLVGKYVTDEAGNDISNYILWGTWLQTIIDFLITALCIFVILRVLMKAKASVDAVLHEKERVAAEAAAKEAEEKATAEKEAAELAAKEAAEKQERLDASALRQERLLEEIRDLLKSKS